MQGGQGAESATGGGWDGESGLLGEILDYLGLSDEDRLELAELVASLGSTDEMLGEYIRWDVRTLEEASETPLLRTPPDALPVADEVEVYYTETVKLPSGRIFQVQRRYPAGNELDRALAKGERLSHPGLWIRELRLTTWQRDRLGLGWIDAATVVEARNPPTS